MSYRPHRLLLAALACSALAACDDGSPTPRTIYTLAVRGGNEQQGPAGSLLDQPLQVTVTDPANTPASRVVVRFRVSAGDGTTLEDTIAVTGPDGVALTRVRLGPAEGQTSTVFAYVARQEDRGVSFSVTATAPATLTSVAPTSFAAGDTVTLTGTNFNSELAGNTVLFGTARGRVISGEGTTTLRVVVPPCVTPGAVEVRVQLGSATTAVVAAQYQAGGRSLELAPSQGVTVSGTEAGNCLVLAANGARYLLIPQYATNAASTYDTLFTPYTIGSAAAAAVQAAVVSRGRMSAAERFHAMLRRQEHLLAPEGARLGNAPRTDGVALQGLELNSTRAFRVLSNLDGTEFATSTAQLKYIGSDILVYVDQETPSAFDDADWQAFGALFNDVLYARATTTFGSESDIDANDHVIVLFTPVVNGLVDPVVDGCGSYVAGFFTGFDLTSRSTNSNKGEVFYSSVPDPLGQKGCPLSASQVDYLTPATFIHEFQHMISYNQHVLARGGSEEDVWLNEGMSLIAEEIGGKYYEAKYPAPSGRSNPTQLFPDSAQGFLVPNLGYAYDYLRSSSQFSITTFKDFGELEERGGAWLFLRWLVDQKGEGILSRLEQTSKTSVANVEDKAGESFAGLFGDFATAVAVEGHPAVDRSTLSARFRFTSRDFREIYARLSQTNSVEFPNPYPVIPQSLAFGAAVDAEMVQGTADFFQLDTPVGTASATIRFSRPSSEVDPRFPSNLEAQLGIFRLPDAP